MSAAFGRIQRIALFAGALVLSQSARASAPSAAAAGAAASAAKAPQRFLSPASGGASAAVFGAGALEVSVFSLGGRRVFHQEQRGGAPISWDCRDGGGRIVPSGVYIARIRTSDSGVVYQSFAVVK